MVRLDGQPPTWREFKRLSRPLEGLEEIGKYRLYADVRGDKVLEETVRVYCRQFMAT